LSVAKPLTGTAEGVKNGTVDELGQKVAQNHVLVVGARQLLGLVKPIARFHEAVVESQNDSLELGYNLGLFVAQVSDDGAAVGITMKVPSLLYK
jgi:hypothetical protein